MDIHKYPCIFFVEVGLGSCVTATTRDVSSHRICVKDKQRQFGTHHTHYTIGTLKRRRCVWSKRCHKKANGRLMWSPCRAGQKRNSSKFIIVIGVDTPSDTRGTNAIISEYLLVSSYFYIMLVPCTYPSTRCHTSFFFSKMVELVRVDEDRYGGTYLRGEGRRLGLAVVHCIKKMPSCVEFVRAPCNLWRRSWRTIECQKKWYTPCREVLQENDLEYHQKTTLPYIPFLE